MGKAVCIIGSGNWGSAIAKIVGNNVRERSELFDPLVRMYVYEEMVDGEKLTELINTKHENVKYLPGVQLPDNVVAVPNLLEASKDGDIFIFVLPHQFVMNICTTMKGNIKKDSIAVSLIKGVSIMESGIKLISDVITEELGIHCSAMMGANLAGEVAQEQFCESTIGSTNEKNGKLLKRLFETPYFHCMIVNDTPTVEICGALKNVVGIGAGIVDGMGYGDNTKAAVIRLGLMEMIKFADLFSPGSQTSTFFQSCGIADLVATCHGGRNRMLGESVVRSSKTVKQLEKELLHGQSFQGPLVAREIYHILETKHMLDQFPMFMSVHKICERDMEPSEFVSCLRNHPEHM
ncbi:glycerol-3-phosphate dehydrogenase [NAD(+)], cytoplasmic-like [Pecten maximus]|uniref:glycerol-3-phosphate dehydrogenase [NAD(+)], cytoplasmic-like n=1 Tax=Pecten maximus TaxID=6579 RepID=UPI001458F880|nr:glycerol-3-phosphate dehydrogenase [NAD(+)], cytoplasmic-like [Pecten maximus]